MDEEDSSIHAPDPNVFPPDPEKFEGQCVSCGYAAKVMANDVLPEDPSITWQERVMGRINSLRAGPTSTQFFLWCFRQEARLRVEEGAYGTYKTLNRKRACPKWIAFEPGQTPQQQFDRAQQMELEKLRNENLTTFASVQAAMRAHIETSTELQREIRDLGKKQDDWSKWALRIAGAALLLAAVGIVFTILTYLHSLSVPIPTP